MISLNNVSRIAICTAVAMLCIVMLAFAAAPDKHVVMEKTVYIGAFAGGQTTPHSAKLSWTAPTQCVDGSACTPTGYNVYKATGACPASGLPTSATKIASAITATTFTDTPLTPGTYCYYVTAIGSAGESSASNTSQGVLAQPAIAAPTNFTVTVQ